MRIIRRNEARKLTSEDLQREQDNLVVLLEMIQKDRNLEDRMKRHHWHEAHGKYSDFWSQLIEDWL